MKECLTTLITLSNTKRKGVFLMNMTNDIGTFSWIQRQKEQNVPHEGSSKHDMCGKGRVKQKMLQLRR